MHAFSQLFTLDVRRLFSFNMQTANTNTSDHSYAHALDKEMGVKILTYSKCESNSKVEPFPRSGHRVVCDDKYLYSFGGYNPDLSADQFSVDDEWHNSNPLFKELWRYNIHTREWKKLSCRNMPSVLASSCAVLSGKLMLVFGGTGAPFGNECSRTLFFCDLTKKDLSFEEVEVTGDLPDPLYGQGIILDKDLLYTVGGTSGFAFSNDIHRLDLKTKVWEKLKAINPQDCPPPRYRHELALYKGEIYMFGGGVNDTAFPLRDIPVFNLERNEWRYIKSESLYPKPRKSHSLVQVPANPNLVIVCGGNNSNSACRDTWMFNIETRLWKPLPKCVLSFNLHFHDSAVTPSGKMITFGGIKSKRSSPVRRSNDVLAAWLCIPSLSDLCFEVLLEAFPDVKSYSLENLYEIGLPSKFIRRIVDDKSTC